MSIELIAVIIVIVAIVAISGKKKKKPDKQTDKPQDKPEPVKPAPVIPDSQEKAEEKPPEKIPVTISKDGHTQEGVMELQKQGLRIYDANGNIMLDATSRLTKYLGTLSIGTTDGSYTDERLREGEFWYATLKLNEYKNCYRIDPETSEFINFLPVITRDGNTIKWKYTDSDSDFRTGLTIIYGVY